jgi:hypothetical protein
MEIFLKKLGKDYMNEAKHQYGKDYDTLTIGGRYDFLTKILLRLRMN